MLRLQQTHSRKRPEREVDLPEAVENRSDGEMQKPRECDWVNRRSTSSIAGSSLSMQPTSRTKTEYLFHNNNKRSARLKYPMKTH